MSPPDSVTAARTLANFIDGGFHAPRDGQYLDDVAPATGAVIARIPASSSDDVAVAVAAAKRAYEAGWGTAPVEQRAALCEAIADQIEARLDEFARLESQDTGKPIGLAQAVDIPRAVANFRFFAGAVRHHASESHAMQNALNYTLRRSLGTVGLITPWNLPLYLLSWKTAPALAMGNTVVAKPSELTPLTAHALAEVVAEVGAPAGVFNLVQGYGADAGQALVEHADIKAVSFTGGTETGARVAATAAPQFKKLSLELGGKNATLVFADAEFDTAVDGAARAAFLNQGQICLCGSRVLVERSIYDRFVESFVAKVRDMSVGDPSDAKTKLGALISTAHREKVESYIALAKQEGGEVLCGGGRPQLPSPFSNGAFLEPTVVAGLAPDCRTATEEIFGPVATVHPFDGESEAVAIANGVRYGLSASIWTRDLARAHRVAAALETGMVWVNTWLLRDLRVPFGGMKDSGVGREGGFRSLDFFSEDRNICIALS